MRGRIFCRAGGGRTLQRKGDLQRKLGLDFRDGALHETSCQRGFINWVGMQKESTGTTKAKVSVLESGSGHLYNARMNFPLPGGKQIVQGEVRVGKSSGPSAGY